MSVCQGVKIDKSLIREKLKDVDRTVVNLGCGGGHRPLHLSKATELMAGFTCESTLQRGSYFICHIYC